MNRWVLPVNRRMPRVQCQTEQACVQRPPDSINGLRPMTREDVIAHIEIRNRVVRHSHSTRPGLENAQQSDCKPEKTAYRSVTYSHSRRRVPKALKQKAVRGIVIQIGSDNNTVASADVPVCRLNRARLNN